jgi:DNA-binding transcriptional LysR family regulator
MLDTRQLHAFAAVAETLHFGRAADRLDIAQSALSRQIRDLEERLGTRLLNRGRRAAVSLTDAGRTLLEEARVALEALERAERAARRAGRGEVGRIEIGYVASAALTGVLPAALGRFRTTHPEVVLEASLQETPSQLTALADGRLDVGFVRPRALYPSGIDARILHEEALLLAVHARHPLARRPVTLARLADERFVLPQFDESAGFAEHLAALARGGGFEPRAPIKVRDFITAIAFAAAGYGVVPVPRSLATLALPDVVYRPIEGYAGIAQLAVAWRRQGLSPAAQAFVTAATVREATRHR